MVWVTGGFAAAMVMGLFARRRKWSPDGVLFKSTTGGVFLLSIVVASVVYWVPTWADQAASGTGIVAITPPNKSYGNGEAWRTLGVARFESYPNRTTGATVSMTKSGNARQEFELTADLPDGSSVECSGVLKGVPSETFGDVLFFCDRHIEPAALQRLSNGQIRRD
ncbi:hypothetical protein [Rathayibacter sp. AY1F3]|uniref:hypothetical protein n=1 Tax=Rathayibacter sp. AY1F3 TaxID=2080558 RepID=UPI0011B03240|nr:hypothetical protein [Rathayibacter sp. AY1F3]